MTHNEIAAICRKVIADSLGTTENGIPAFPWESLIFDFALVYASQDLTEQQVKEMFQDQVEKQLQYQREAREEIRSKVYQRHHDHYVRLHREGKLDPKDIPKYNLAMQREQEGLVKALSE